MKNYFFETFPGLQPIFDQTAYRDVRSLAFLHCLVKAFNPPLVLELGTGKGCSTAFMALALPREYGMIVTIDNYLREDINNPGLVSKNLRGCGVEDRVTLLRGTTFEADSLFTKAYGKGSEAGIVFMDSSHVHVNLRREYEVIRSVVSERHILVIDDVFFNDAMDFILELVKMERYPSSLLLPYHLGVAVLVSHNALSSVVNTAVDECLVLLGKET